MTMNIAMETLIPLRRSSLIAAEIDNEFTPVAFKVTENFSLIYLLFKSFVLKCYFFSIGEN